MIRSIVAAACLAIAATAVVAQTDVIAERKNIMKGNGAAARAGTQMIRGEVPFDAARAKEAFAGIQAGMTRFPTLFPENSKTGGETKASPRIWDDMAGFRAAAAKVVQDATAASASTTDLASFQASFQRVAANCNSCHETYRINTP
ncbi:MAG TPA: cytochrome c [Microvirga sp.]|jgi:cytochrome c556|nr:cytochrome c [Microvirga sp.]